MDDYRYNGNVIEIIGGDNPKDDQLVSGSEPPTTEMNQSMEISKLFFKTQMCERFKLGTCMNTTNCNYAHSIKELRYPPPNWKQIVANNQIGSSSLIMESQRCNNDQYCEKFYSETGCRFGDECDFLHDLQSEIRERTAILLTPGSSGDGGVIGSGGSVAVNSSVKPTNLKTKICRKWEQTSFCPFGSRCIFAHGTAELQRYGGGVVAQEANPNNNNNNNNNNNHQGLTGSSVARFVAPPGSSSAVQRPLKRWKGPDKISRVYGDWIDELE